MPAYDLLHAEKECVGGVRKIPVICSPHTLPVNEFFRRTPSQARRNTAKQWQMSRDEAKRLRVSAIIPISENPGGKAFPTVLSGVARPPL
jgi:hypothetical protein